MTRPWVLIASSAVVAGALLGVLGVMLVGVITATVAIGDRRSWLLVLLLTLAAGLLGVARAGMHEPVAAGVDVVTSQRAEVVVASYPQRGPSGPRAVVRVERVRAGPAGWIETSGEVLVFFGDTVPGGVTRGDRLRLVWQVTGSDGYDPDFRRFLAASNVAAGAWTFNAQLIARGDASSNLLVRLRDTVTDGVRRAIGGDAGALIAGFVTGDDSGLSDAAREAFDQTNTSHITAVSGANVAVLVSMWLVLVPTRRLRRSLPAMVGVVALIWLYVVLVGMGPGAVRAGLFATIMLPASRLGRRSEPLTALVLASALMVLVRPGYAENVGFWLSLAASAAMVTVLSPVPARRMPLWQDGILALVAAQVATLPITFAVFDGWSPASLVSNLVIGPLVALFFPFAFGFSLLLTLLPWLGGVLGWLPALGANLIIAVVESMAGAFPMLRPGAMPATGIGVVAVLCASVIALASVDARRWARRVQWRLPASERSALAASVGVGVGVWLAVVVGTLLR